MLIPDEEWPRISLWYSRRGRVIRYEEKVIREESLERDCELILGLDRLR